MKSNNFSEIIYVWIFCLSTFILCFLTATIIEPNTFYKFFSVDLVKGMPNMEVNYFRHYRFFAPEVVKGLSNIEEILTRVTYYWDVRVISFCALVTSLGDFRH